MKTKEKVSFIHSIKAKIILLVFLAITLATGLCMWTFMPLMKENMRNTIQSYMKDVAIIAGRDLDREISVLGAEAVLTAEELESAVGSINIRDMDSSYAYVVSSDGTMLYHPTAEKIGLPVENQAVTSLVGELANGNRPETDVIEYEFKGVIKYASFYVGSNSEYIVVITADEEEVFEGTDYIVRRCIYSSILTVLICTLITLFVAVRIVKPIEKISDLVAKISGFDFRKDDKYTSVVKKKDETGMMGRSIENLRSEFTAVVARIKNQSEELYDASQTLNVNASETASSVEQVEKAISEIAQGANAQAQETQTATENVIFMGNMVEETNEEVEKLRETMRDMRSAGESAMDILKELSAVNQKTKDAMQVIYEQTNVTNESARQIEEIINVLIAESQKSVATMEEVREVIEKQDENVTNTQNAFENVKDGISSSIDGIRVIAGKTEKLDEARVKVVDVVQNLTAIAQENAASTEETSASAAEVGAIMGNIAENANQLNQIAQELEESVEQFIVE